MIRATLTETKNNLSALVDQVRHGESILILDRGRPVARLESVLEGDSASEGRLARLERQGLVRRGVQKSLRDLLKRRPPRPQGGASALDELLEERRSGR
jgi:prevent-host-death family protein